MIKSEHSASFALCPMAAQHINMVVEEEEEWEEEYRYSLHYCRGSGKKCYYSIKSGD